MGVLFVRVCVRARVFMEGQAYWKQISRHSWNQIYISLGSSEK